MLKNENFKFRKTKFEGLSFHDLVQDEIPILGTFFFV